MMSKNKLFYLIFNSLLLVLILSACFEAMVVDRYLVQSSAERMFRILVIPFDFSWFRYGFWNMDRLFQQLVIASFLKVNAIPSFQTLANLYSTLVLTVPFWGGLGMLYVSKIFNKPFYLYWSVINFTALSFGAHAYLGSSLSYSMAFMGVLLPIVLYRKSDSDRILLLIYFCYFMSALWNDRSFYMSFVLAIASFKNYKEFNKRSSSLLLIFVFIFGGLLGGYRYFERLFITESYLQSEIFKLPGSFVLWYTSVFISILFFVVLVFNFIKKVQFVMSALLFLILAISSFFFVYYFIINNQVNFSIYENRHYVSLLTALFAIIWLFYQSPLESIFKEIKHFRFSMMFASLFILVSSLVYDYGFSLKWQKNKEQYITEFIEKEGCYVMSKEKIYTLDTGKYIWSWPAFSILIQKTYQPHVVVIPEGASQVLNESCHALDFKNIQFSSLSALSLNQLER